MKKIAFYFFCGCLLSAASIVARAQGGNIDGSALTWSISGGTLTISGSGAMPNFVSDGQPWAEHRTAITNVVIGNNITNIGAYAFELHTEMASVTIGTSVDAIGDNSFWGCNALTALSVPNSVTAIGNNAFSSCSRMTTLTLGTGVQTIGNYTFQSCMALTSLVIPNNVAAIGDGAFAGCSGINYLTIGNNVATIGYSAFSNCTKLISITLLRTSPLTIAPSVFANCRINLITLIVPQGAATTYSQADVWKDFYIEGVSSLPTGPCGANLTWTYNMNGTLTISGTGAMTNYSQQELPPWNNFAGIQTVVVNSDVTSVGSYAFANCAGLTTLSLPEGLLFIGESAFQNCPLLSSVSIPASVTGIGAYAFRNCAGLTAFNVATANNNFSTDDGVLYNKSKMTLIQYPAGKAGTSFAIPDGVIIIGPYAFYACRGLNSVTFSSSVQTIQEYAFNRCSGLTSVTIPANITGIHATAFLECPGLILIVDANNNNYTTEDGVLFNKTKTTLIRYPISKQGAYSIPEGVRTVGAYAFQECQGLTSVTMPNSLNTISMYAFQFCTGLTSVNFGNSLTNIDGYAFAQCNKLNNVVIPNTVTSINDYAFSQCAGLTSVTMSGNLMVINPYTFYGCSALTSVTIPNSVQTIGDYAFSNCAELTSVQIGSKVQMIGNYAFNNCVKLSSVSMGINVNIFGLFAFANCRALPSIVIPANVGTIYQSAFTNCIALTEIINLAENPQMLSVDPFGGVNKTTCVLRVPAGAATRYRSATFWMQFQNIVELTDAKYAVTFVTTVPVETPSGATVRIAGNFPELGYGFGNFDITDPDLVMTKGGDGKYSITLNLNSGTVQYKYTLNNSWENMEKAATHLGSPDCASDITRGQIIVKAATFNDEVLNWNGITTCLPPFPNGSGTEQDPYIISTAAQLYKLMEVVNNGNTTYNNKYYQLNNDIDLVDYQSGQGWIPIGLYNPPNNSRPFKGVFDGNHKIITGLYINNTTFYSVGLFGYLNGAIVKNLGVVKANINTSLSASESNRIGIIAGHSDGEYVGEISNCFASGNINGTTSQSDCTVGGILGDNNHSKIYDCYSTATVRTVTPYYTRAGGIIGLNANGDVSNCYSTGFISAEGSTSYAGGIAGDNWSKIYNCAALNPEIKAIGNTFYIGRVAGNGSNQTNNVAFDFMKNPDGATVWNNIGANRKDGEDITKENILADGTINGLFTSSIWTTQAGRLPGLFGETLEIPIHITRYKTGETGGLTWTFSDGTLSISGTGTMPDYAYQGQPWFDLQNDIKAVVIEYGVTTIGQRAFQNCINMTSVEMPESLITIGFNAFQTCEKLTTVDIPNSVITVDRQAFILCSKLTSVRFGNQIETIGPLAFQECAALESVVLPNSLITIDYQAFCYCYALKSVVIGNSVKTIGDNAFAVCNTLSSLTIGNSVESIGDYAFSKCHSLTSVVVPQSVTFISDYAFVFNISLTSIEVENGNTKYSSEDGILFNIDKTEIITYPTGKSGSSYSIPNTVAAIKCVSFYYCDLSLITIPASVNTIYEYAFEECYGLSAIINEATTPQEINENVFSGVDLSAVTLFVPAGKVADYEGAAVWQDFGSIQEIASGPCPAPLASGKAGNLDWFLCHDGTFTISGTGEMPNYTSATQQPWAAHRNAIKTLVVESGITRIGNYAFQNCDHLADISLPASMITIGTRSFENCGFVKLTIPNTVNTIGEYAFMNSSALKELVIENSATALTFTATLGSVAVFSGCSIEKLYLGRNTSYSNINMNSIFGSAIKEVVWGSNVTAIGVYAFRNCTGLTAVHLPANLTTINDYAFYGCTGLTTITIPEEVTSVGSYAFSNCSELTTVYFNATDCASFSSAYPAFTNCSKLKAIFIGDNVTVIAPYAFQACNGLTRMDLPVSVTTIGNYAFSNCNGLTLFTNHATTPQVISANVFNNLNKTTCILRVPVGYVDEYRKVQVWQDFLNILEFTDGAPIIYTTIAPVLWHENEAITLTPPTVDEADTQGWQISADGKNWTDFTATTASLNEHGKYLRFYATNDEGTNYSNVVKISVVSSGCTVVNGGIIGSLTWWICDDGTLTISGEGAMPNYTSYNQPWYSLRNSITSLVIESGVTHIGNYAFYDLVNLATITFPESVKTIGGSAFSSCNKLTSVTIPNSLNTIGSGAFSNCKGLKTVQIGTSVTSIGESAFSYCEELTTVYFNATNCISMGGSYWTVFMWCDQLTTVVIGAHVETIPENAFDDCSALSVVVNHSAVPQPINANVFSDVDKYSCILRVPEGSIHAYSDAAVWKEFLIKEFTVGGPIIIGDIEGIVWRDGEEITLTAPTVSGADTEGWQISSNGEYWTIFTPPATASVNDDGKQLRYYATNSVGTDYSNVVKINVIDCSFIVGGSAGPLAWWLCADSVLTVRGTGAMPNYPTNWYRNTAPWEEFVDEIAVVIIEDGVERIGNMAFHRCNLVRSVNLGNTMKTIGNYAFGSCALTTVTIPESVTFVGEGAFSCRELTTLYFNATHCPVSGSSYDAPFGYYLENIHIGDKVTMIPDNAFAYNRDFTLIVIPESVTTIGNNAFYECTSLTSIVISEGVISLGDYAFESCHSLTTVVIPDGVISIGERAFYDCYELLSVVIPESLTSIGDEAFSDCGKLTSIINFAATPQTINANVFDYVDKTLCLLRIPANTEEDYLNAAVWKDFLNMQEFNANGPLVVGIVDPFVWSDGDAISLTAPEVINADTQGWHISDDGETGWTTFSDLVATMDHNGKYMRYFAQNSHDVDYSDVVKIYVTTCTIAASGVTGPLTWWLCDDGKLTIQGEGAMPDYLNELYGSISTPWYRGSITSVEIGEGVSSIGSGAFYWCSELTTVSIPNSVTTIGNSAFYLCSELTTVSIPNSVTTIGSNAFRLSGLTNITIPEKITTINSSAFRSCTDLETVYFNAINCNNMGGSSNNAVFSGCDQLKNVYIGNMVERIPNYAFYGSAAITAITFPDAVTDIGNYAFYGCSGLTTLTIGASVTSIGSSAFYNCTELTIVYYNATNCNSTVYNILFSGCSKLTDVIFGNNVQTIPYNAFYGCNGLTSLTLPISLTQIGPYAFYGCSGIKTALVIPAMVTSIGAYAFQNCGITSVFIPDETTSIGASAFTGCPLKEVTTPLAPTNAGLFPAELEQLTVTDQALSFTASFLSACHRLRELTLPFIGTGSNATGSTAVLGVLFGNINTEMLSITNAAVNQTYRMPGGLEKVTVTSAVQIGAGAFYGCEMIQEVILPETLQTVGTEAFFNCTGLQDLTCNAIEPPSAYNESTFKGVDTETCLLHIPEGSVDDYIIADGWKEFDPSNIKEKEEIAVAGVTISPSTANMKIGDMLPLTAVFNPANATNKKATWNSSDNNVATVGLYGIVTAKAEGVAIITVTTQDGSFEGSCTVTVRQAVTGVSLNYASLTMTVGATKLTATVAPSTATNKTVTWSSDNPTVATVDVDGNVTALALGTAVITVRTNDGDFTASCTVSVIQRVTGVSLNKKTLTLGMGDMEQLVATIYPATATNKNVTWRSSNTAVATIDNDGLITAHNEGKTNITVTTQDGSFADICELTVLYAVIPVTSVGLNTSSISIKTGDSYKLWETVLPANATTKTVKWSSNKTSVATVDKDGTIHAVSEGAAVIVVTTDDGDFTASCVVNVWTPAPPVPVSGIRLNTDLLRLAINYGASLNATIFPDNATNRTLIWTTADANIATVSGSGYVTGKSAGETLITVKTQDGEYVAHCDVWVSRVPVTGVQVSHSSMELIVGRLGQQLTATISPVNATNKTVKWRSVNDATATIVDHGSYCIVTGVAVGSTLIVATSEEGGYSDECIVTVVEPVHVTGISLNKSVLSLSIGQSERLTGTITPSDATEKSVTWTSDNSTVATVSSSGTVMAHSTGTAYITATTKDGGFAERCEVSVSYIAVSGLSLDKKTLDLDIGYSSRLTVAVSPSNATNKNMTWRSSDETVARVDNSGNVTGVAAGTATITATSVENASYSSVCMVTVRRVNVYGIRLNKFALSLPRLKSYQLTATIFPNNATNKSVAWTSSDYTAVAVDQNGWVTALKDEGSAVITAITADGNYSATCVVTLLKPIVINAPALTIQPSIVVRGVAPPNTTINIYDGNQWIGETASTTNGNYILRCLLYDPRALSLHRIRAEVVLPDDGGVMTSETRSVIHDISAIVVSKVTMYNTATTVAEMDPVSFATVFDFLNPSLKGEEYWFSEDRPDFTFTIEFTENNPVVISNVRLHVFTTAGTVIKLPTVYDETKGHWLVQPPDTTFKIYALPINVNVDFSTSKEPPFDTDYIISLIKKLTDILNNIKDKLGNAEDLLAKILAELEKTNPNRTQIVQWMAEFEIQTATTPTSQTFIDTWKDSNPGDFDKLVDNTLGEAETLVADLEKKHDEYLKSVQNFSLYGEREIEMEDGTVITVTVTTCEQLSEIEYMADDSWTKIPITTTQGRYIFTKLTENEYISVDFELNIYRTVRVSQSRSRMERMSSEEWGSAKSGIDGAIHHLSTSGINAQDYETAYLAYEAELQQLQRLDQDLYDELTVLIIRSSSENNSEQRISIEQMRAELLSALNKHTNYGQSLSKVPEYLAIVKGVETSYVTTKDNCGKVDLFEENIPSEADETESQSLENFINLIQTRLISEYTGALNRIVSFLFIKPLSSASLDMGAITLAIIEGQSEWDLTSRFNHVMGNLIESVDGLIEALRLKYDESSDDHPEKGPCPDAIALIESSSYVYEAVAVNRVKAVKVTTYYKANEYDEPALWVADDSHRDNPQITDETGKYLLDVPQGMFWQADFEKDGYTMVSTEWKEALPNSASSIGIVQSVAPQVIGIQGSDVGLTIEFDKYMQSSTLTDYNITVERNGTPVSGTVSRLDERRNPKNDDEFFAPRVIFEPDQPFATTDEVSLTVAGAVTSYAGVTMGVNYVQQQIAIVEEIKTFTVTETLDLLVNEMKTIEVTATPAYIAAGMTVSARSISSILEIITPGALLDENGKAILQVRGSYKGATSVIISIDETNLKRYTNVEITTTPPVIEVNQKALNFSEVKIGTTSEVQSVNVFGSNITGSILHYIAGDDPSAFTVDETAWNSAIGGRLSVTFRPDAERTYNARLVIMPLSHSELQQTVELSGAGVTNVTQSVTSVTVSPAEVTVQKGTTQKFTATVTVTGSAPEDVTWTVTGKTAAGTSINEEGLLTVAVDETAATLTVTATSGFDPTKQGTATVTVTDASAEPTIISVAVAPNTVSVQKGATQQFTATVVVTGGASEAVTWSVSGNAASGTAISAVGLLTVAAGETAATLTVDASSVEDPTKKGTATVTVIATSVTSATELFAPDLKAYPNPFTGAVRLIGAEGCVLQIINAAGVIQHTQKIENTEETLRLERLPDGVYFFRVEKEGKSKTVRVVKN